MDLTLFYTVIGFLCAGYSVIGNDSIQTLGTFIASKSKHFKWYILASTASVAMILTISYGWYFYDGDISYGRLKRIPERNCSVVPCGSSCCTSYFNQSWNSSLYNFLSFIGFCIYSCFRKSSRKEYCRIWSGSNYSLRAMVNYFKIY